MDIRTAFSTQGLTPSTLGGADWRSVVSDLNCLLSPAELAGLRASPRFDEATDSLAKAALRALARADDAGRWMFRDIGRGSLYLSTVVLNASGGVTASNLAASARTNQSASRGRVMAFLRRVEASGELTVPPGSGAWTQRRLVLGQRLVDRFRQGVLFTAEAVALLAPDVAPIVARLSDDAYFGRLVIALAKANAAAVERDTAGAHGERLFLDRDCGIGILLRLMSSQPRPRERLLEKARLSRAALSREFGVSRAHIYRLLADATTEGLLTFPTSDTVTFSPTFSDDIEHLIVRTLQVTRVAMLMAAEESC